MGKALIVLAVAFLFLALPGVLLLPSTLPGRSQTYHYSFDPEAPGIQGLRFDMPPDGSITVDYVATGSHVLHVEVRPVDPNNSEALYSESGNRGRFTFGPAGTAEYVLSFDDRDDENTAPFAAEITIAFNWVHEANLVPAFLGTAVPLSIATALFGAHMITTKRWSRDDAPESHP